MREDNQCDQISQSRRTFGQHLKPLLCNKMIMFLAVVQLKAWLDWHALSLMQEVKNSETHTPYLSVNVESH